MTRRTIGLMTWLLMISLPSGASARFDQVAQVSVDQKNATYPARLCAEPTKAIDATLRQFLPFMGEWRSNAIYKQESGPDLAGAGTEKIRLSMDGKAIEVISEFEDPYSPGAENFVNKAVWMVRPESDALVGVAINSLGNRKFLDGAIDKNDLVITVHGEMFGGADQIERYRYHLTAEDRIEVSLNVSTDKGATWKGGWYEAAYERVRQGERSNCS